jgi:hypothetical protein
MDMANDHGVSRLDANGAATKSRELRSCMDEGLAATETPGAGGERGIGNFLGRAAMHFFVNARATGRRDLVLRSTTTF